MRIAAAAAAIACVLLAGCGGSAKSEPAKTARDPAPPHVTVLIRSFKYRPATLNVKAGTRVTWRNEDSSPHTATSHADRFTTRVLEQGQSRTLTLTRPGRFTYVCVIHPFMHGRVVVTR